MSAPVIKAPMPIANLRASVWGYTNNNKTST